MAPIYRRRATNTMPDPFAQLDDYRVNSDGINTPSTSKKRNNIRNNNANAQQYPYPLSSAPINHGPDSPVATQSSFPTPSNPVNMQGEAGAQTFVQAAQSNSTVVTGSSTISLSPISSSTSPPSTHLTSTGSTISTLPPGSIPLSEPTNPPSLTFLSQNFSDIDSSALTTSLSTSDNTAPTSSIQISSTGVILLMALGGLILVTTLVCILRCGLRQWRHNRRRRKQSAFDFSHQAEKEPWDGEKGGTLGVGSGIEAGGSPSTIFGGQERTGLTPQPSWTTFHEGERNDIAAATSPYPLGLLPPPASHRQVGASTWRRGGPATLTALGISHPGFPSRLNGSPRNISQPYPPLQRTFEPPTITITNSSPRQSGHGLRTAGNGSRVPPPLASANDGVSPTNSYNRMSVYTHPTNGAQLVKPPRLMLANEDESDAGPRQGGWSSWDDNVGVELGVRIDRGHLPPKRKSRIPVSKVKVGISPPRMTLAPVMEISDSEGNLTKPSSSSKSPTSPNSSLHPNNPNSRLRHGPSPPSSPLRRSPRSMKSASPRMGKGAGKQAAPQQRLYNLPQFEATSPNSMRVASPASPLPSFSTANSASNSPMPSDGGGSQKRKSRRVSGRPANNDLPASTVSETLSDAYAYVYEYARDLSSTDSEEIQIRRTSKRGSKSSRIDGDRLGGERTKGSVQHSPVVRDTIGALMMKGYDEEGAITSPSMLWSGEKRRRGGAGGNLPGGRGREPFGKVNTNGATPGPMKLHGLGASTKDQRRSRDQTRQKQQQQQPPRRRSRNTPTGLSVSPQSVYSEYPVHQHLFQQQQQQQHQQRQEVRGVPSLPPLGMPNLHQLKLMREMPDYRSPTYSMYGMYREDGNGKRASPLVPPPSPSPSPLPSAASAQYRYASASGTGRVAWRVDMI